jgi:hypothetical protein
VISRARNGSRRLFGESPVDVVQRTRRSGAQIIVASHGIERRMIEKTLQSREFLYNVYREHGRCQLCICSSRRRRATRLMPIVCLFQSAL